ncbi:MAG: bifunctional 2-C-methyl-D-erythritol 4-phosphate cytidylyltransferase/2-C-methyl-D-erythritol 2,4-cyclodiphosphate synthase [Alphaproteobacteria bacterium]|nr:bifunctional 2-C-methyl-D-erythritol 4-phosphate cytidylyltransferase/2-C-methyl-D-erythritol 2,4-cyclodiphosphate synthase [Alphaproteobacteria bacterium]
MSLIPRFHVVLVAAGGGVRSGQTVPKQYCPLGGQPILRHSLNTFRQIPGLDSLITVINPEHSPLYEAAVKGFSLPSPIPGGKTRKESVFKGLEALPSADDRAIVLIHDAARPFVRQEDIMALVQTIADGAEAATLAHPVADTVLYALMREGDPFCGEPAQRTNLWAVQTPQAFRLGVIKKAHMESPAELEATDDAGLVRAMGVDVKLVQGSPLNLKITYPKDLAVAEEMYAAMSEIETRTGTGYDVHAFAETEDSPQSIRLCGVDIPFGRRLAGHSDADVGLHALTDAILGAIGGGDIGTHFPPSNPAFKGMDSAAFLKHASDLLKQKGGYLINADITMICEAPKIGPHRDAIVARIAEILAVPPDRINIKATTTEGLGFTGRREGIAAQAAVNVALPRGRPG